MSRSFKKIGLTALAIAALSSAAAVAVTQQGAAPAVAQAATVTAAKAPPVPLLWKVSDRDNAVYLLGSFHLLKADDYPLSNDIDTALAAADKVVFEVPPEQVTDPATGEKFRVAAGFADGRTLSQVLPADMREKLSRIMAMSGASIDQLDSYEPWFVNLSLMLGVSQSLGFSPDKGLDQYLMQQAAAVNKPTGGLETMELQFQVLDSAPMTEQISSLREFLDRPQDMPGMLTDLHQAWRDGNVARLDELSRKEMQEKTPQTYRQINIERNDAWVPKIRGMLDGVKKGDTLVVVGALHLLGQDGVVEKLRGHGYTIERVCTACNAANDGASQAK
ncbi:TraB/GumN family protein [Lysobacter niastensis]|uniref:TraB/GumN family protein n=1 Tax=Lysobacter niastensis TaxID=380629 RepID=A0ABS0B9B5_9GAMM|nr:TraB/GumN family protein [Lysobacter niastensis]MBF6024352.1 TraB/GumN family protein [Lysobacter niastensis]